MSATNIRLYQRPVAAVSSLLNNQLGIEITTDADLGFNMAGYKDFSGTTQKLLAKDQAARVTDLQITGALLISGDIVVPAGKALYFCKIGTDKTSTGTVKMELTSEGLVQTTI